MKLNHGDIVVIDHYAGTGGRDALFWVDPITGARTILSDFGVGVNQGVQQIGVVVVRLRAVGGIHMPVKGAVS